MNGASALYCGKVVHKRLHPRRHKLSYSVYSFLIDLDELPELEQGLRLFSHNRFNLFSIHDRDHGPGDGTEMAGHVRALVAEHGIADADGCVLLLCYPRLLGYGFNPISVYFCHDRERRLQAVVYEVNNTFGERRSYVFATPDKAARQFHGCDKELYVSPFNPVSGRYSFHLRAPAAGERESGAPLTVGVFYRDGGRPVMNAHFSAERRSLNDRELLLLLARYPLMTLKVIGAIHYEALKLWLKGLRLVARAPAPAYSVTQVDRPQMDGTQITGTRDG